MTRHLPYDRAQRIADQIHQIIATACITELSDPRLSGMEITRVRMTKDLKIARVYFHLREKNEERINTVKEGLESAKGFFKRQINEELELKYIPEFEYFYDEAIDLEEKIDSLMA